MRLLLAILFTLCAATINAQEYVYVNTDNLLLRDRPLNLYSVFTVLHAPCQLEIIEYDDGYVKNKAITARFYSVMLAYPNARGGYVKVEGYVEKKYVVRSKGKVTVRGVDTAQDVAFTDVPSIPYIGSLECDPNDFNCRDFPYPKYKGGEKQFPAPVKRVYHNGPAEVVIILTALVIKITSILSTVTEINAE